MTRFTTMATALSLACLAIAAANAHAEDNSPTEKQKIESLIKHVGELKDAKFNRNGTEYKAADAVKLLKHKWDDQTKEIKTAKDFIEKVATKSSMSGKPYTIKFKDGTEKKSGEYLTEQLKKIEKEADEKEKQKK